ncbi:MAG: AtpZ/AtpI family protein [Terriglobia bacterium]
MPKTSDKRMGPWEKVGYYSSLGIVLPAGAVGGLGLGWVLDRWLHTKPIFTVILCLVGAGAGIIDILRILTRAEKQDDADESNHGSGAS